MLRFGYLLYTAWDSEIESLTSLITLHQNERRSAPCGQVGAATQPPVLATSPTLKKFWVARAFEVRWARTCCHDRTGFNCCPLPLSHFSIFFVSLGALHNPKRCVRRSGQSVTASDFGSNGPRFESGRGRCVESLDKALYSHCPKEKPSH